VVRPPEVLEHAALRDLGRRLDGVDDALEDPSPLRHAAVLAVILDWDADEPRLLLIERSEKLPSHAGQLAFPGGKPEAGDDSLLATALREANEEVGLTRDGLTVLGRLKPVPTPTGFMIVPFVARAPDDFVPQRCSPEVHAILQPTLAELVRTHRFRGEATWGGWTYSLHEFSIHDPPLWGATARMAWDLLQRIAS
jgi:8-oxo-dGTP pyrophosphatase MutT (NUDIX family)